MEPFSMLGIVGTAFSVASQAWTVGQQLYQFCQDSKTVDAQAQAFANETMALGSACGAVGKRLEEISRSEGRLGSGSVVNDTTETWMCLQSQLTACEVTVTGLQYVVSSIVATADPQKGHNFITSAIRQIKINMKAANIAEARNRIQSHIASLQLVLQAFTIDIIYLTPQRVDQNLQAQLADLASKREGLQGLIANRSDDPPDSLDISHEKDILRTSEKVLSSGETLYSASVAGISVAGDVPPGKSLYVQDWIQQTNDLEDLTSNSSVYDPFGTSSDDNTRSGLASLTEDTASTANIPKLAEGDEHEYGEDRDAKNADIDPEDEFRMEAATAAIAEGRALFDAKDYSAANSTLQEALVMIRELPIKHQAVGDPCDLRFMLGVCAFHLHDPAIAEAALLSVVEATPRAKIQNNTRRFQVLDAGHLLAVTYLRLGKPDQAKICCESTLQGRRKLLGKDDASSHESLALMARILELQGNQSRSRIFTSMLPQERRVSLTQSFSELSLPGSGKLQEHPQRLPLSTRSASESTSSQLPPYSTSEPEIIRGVSIEKLVTSPDTESPDLLGSIPTVCPQDYQPPSIANAAERERRWKFLIAQGLFPEKPPTFLRALIDGRPQESFAFISKDNNSLKRWMSGSKASQHMQNLALAALFGDENVVSHLITVHQTDVQQRDSPSPKPIQFAVLGGYADIVDAIIGANGNVNATSSLGTPLGVAILLERLDIVDLLLRKGAHLNATSHPLGSPLSIACATLNMSLFEALCRHPRCDLNKFCYMRLDHFYHIRKYLDNPQDEPIRRLLSFCGSIIPGWRRRRALSKAAVDILTIEAGLVGVAALFGHAVAIRFLHDRKANVNDTATLGVLDTHGTYYKRVYSPLTLAAMGGSVEAIEALFACGADVPDVKDVQPNVRDTYRYNDPLMHAIRNGHADCAVKLLERSCPIDPRDLTWAGRERMENVVSKAKDMRAFSNWITIHVRFVADQSTITIFVRPDESIRNVKWQLHECARSTIASKLRLLYYGREFENDERTLDSYQITDGAMIYVPAN